MRVHKYIHICVYIYIYIYVYIYIYIYNARPCARESTARNLLFVVSPRAHGNGARADKVPEGRSEGGRERDHA